MCWCGICEVYRGLAPIVGGLITNTGLFLQPSLSSEVAFQQRNSRACATLLMITNVPPVPQAFSIFQSRCHPLPQYGIFIFTSIANYFVRNESAQYSHQLVASIRSGVPRPAGLYRHFAGPLAPAVVDPREVNSRTCVQPFSIPKGASYGSRRSLSTQIIPQNISSCGAVLTMDLSHQPHVF